MADGLTDDEVAALARAFHRPSSATTLLDRAGLDRSEQPTWSAHTSLEFWREIGTLLDVGLLVDGRRRILAAASQSYPVNPVFLAGLAATSVLLLAVEPVRFSATGAPLAVDWRDGLRGVLDRAARGWRLPPGALRVGDRGTRLLGVIRGDVSATRVVADLVGELTRAAAAHNSAHAAADRIRLRLALHLSSRLDVSAASAALEGSAAATASRLVDAVALDHVLRESPAADVALIISAALFESAVRPRLPGLDPAAFHRVDVNLPGRGNDRTAWVGVFSPLPAADANPSRDDDRTPVPGGVSSWDFIVSVADEDHDWGEWLAWELESSGHHVHLHAWDVVAGQYRTNRLDEAIRNTRRMLVVLTEHYLRAPRMQAEWTTMWDTDPAGVNRRLIPVRVEVCRPEGLLRGISYIDLVGLDDDAAKAALRRGLEASLSGRFRPSTPPPFPSSRRGG
ncbi:toll/interleukin-1 receptor domain-containing protein [Frankia sp. AgKG'84/4]|uniref:toll/interleukin-1 receptor domain-containing protein n=1 Tax=Frankia sp. AgKG'84/4 TaxID=573490 RepID=UPI00200FA68C|nr:toll/interleukin-1 receptor domain-containing protein [Frankia sp. AgKG'84/4]MCL9793172.1 toll/interleukin-1 receptor domain-containing protein [Frankia sp. AgKG'84/4]